MDYLNSILSQQNQVQLVEEAIPTLCNRLQHATLSSDRRSAVLGLKSFSRQYRESVVEYGLRPLISTFHKDSKNLVIVKAILETLIILFIRGDSDEDLTRGWISQQSRIQNGKYPSPLLMDDVSLDQFSMWIADELTQNNDVIELLLEILHEYPDFHIRLYALQLLESLVSSRPIRTKECLLNIPTAVSILVSLLDDPNDPVRNEAILLLMAVVNNNFNIQKLVAFENTFDKLFDIITEEGGIRGSILVQDCLTLITNLLQYNASNQKYFLETQCVPRLGSLLGEPVEEGEEGGENLTPIVWTEQRLQNMIITLEICSAFVNEDNEFILQNQNLMFKAGIHFTVLKLVFSPITNNHVRSIALLTAGDLIQGNPEIQFEFSRIDVPYIDPSLPAQLQTYDRPVPVSMALLNWTLFINSVHAFTIRQSAAACLHAYFKDNKETKSQFLSEQIKAYSNPNYYHELEKEKGNSSTNGTYNEESKTETPFGNIFSTLMDYDSNLKLNPYRLWFAALILMYVFEDSDENKEVAREVKTGDEAAGEEVMSSIQAISGLLITTLDSADPRIPIGYLMLLIVWLYENCNAVDDFLSDPSITRSILAYLSNNSSELGVLTHGLSTILLGVVYEFSSKQSPTPRADLHALLIKALGRDNYTLRVKQFRESEVFKNFDQGLILHASKDESGLPDVYFNAIFVNLITENFSRIRKALFHDPNADPHGKLSFDLFEELDTKVADLRKELQTERDNATNSETELKKEIEKLNSSHEDLKKFLEESNIELEELKAKHILLSDNYTRTSETLKSMKASKLEFETSSKKYYTELQDALKKASTTGESAILFQSKLESTEAAKKKLEEGINNMTRDLFHLKKQKSDAEANIKKVEKDLASSRKELKDQRLSYEQQIDRLNKTLDAFKAKVEMLQVKVDQILKEKEAYASDFREKLEDSEATNEHLMDKLRAASSAFQELKQAKSAADKDIGSLKEQLTSKERALEKMESLKEQLVNKEEEIKNLLEKTLGKEEALKEIVSLKEQLRAKLSEIDELKKQISSKDKEMDTLKYQLAFKDEALKEIDTLKKEITSLLDSKQKISLELVSLRALSNSEIEGMNKNLETIQSSNHELMSQNQSIQDEINVLREDIKTRGENYDSLVKESELLQKDLKEQIKALSAKLEAAENLVTSTKDTHLNVSRELTAFKKDHARTKSDLTEQLNSALKKHESSLQDLKERSSTIEMLKKTHKSDLGVLEEKNLITSKKLSSIEGELSLTRDELSSTEKKVSELESQLKAAHKMASDEQTKASESHASTEKIQLELDTLRTHKTELKESYDLKCSELDSAHKELTSAKNEVDGLNKKIEQLNKSSSAEKAKLNDLNKLSTERSEVIEGLKKQITSTETNLGKQNKLLEQSNAEKESLKNETELLQAELETRKKDHDSEILELNQRIESSSSSIGELKSAVKKHELVASKFQSKISTLEKELEEKVQKMTLDSKKIESLQKNLESEQKSHSSSKEIIATLKEQLAQIKKALETSKSVEDKLKTNLDKLTKELKVSEKALGSTKTKLNNEISQLNSELQEKEKKIESLEADLKEKILDVAKERAMLSESSETVIKEYADKIKGLEETLNIAQKANSKKIDVLSAEKSSLQRQLDDITNDYASMKSDSEELKKELKDLLEISSADKVIITTKDTEKKDLESTLKGMSESKTLLEKNLAVIKQKVELQAKEIEERENEVIELKSEIESLKKEVDSLKKIVETSENSSSELKTLLTEEKSTSSSYAKQVEELKDEVSKMKIIKQELNNSIREKEEEIAKCKKEFRSEISSQREIHAEASNKLTGQVEALKSDIANKVKEVVNLQKSASEKSNDSEGKIKVLNAELVKLNSELADVKKELDEKVSIVSELTESRKAHLTQELDLKKSNDSLKLKLETANKGRKEVDELLEQNKEQQIATRAANSKLEAKLNELKEAKNELESKLKIATEDSKNQKSAHALTVVNLKADFAKAKEEKEAVALELQAEIKCSKETRDSALSELEAKLKKATEGEELAISKLKDVVANFEQKQKEITTEITQRSFDLAKVTAEKQDLASKLEKCAVEFEDHKKESSAAKAKLETELNNLNKSLPSIEQLEEENKSLKDKVKEAEAQAEDLKSLTKKLHEAEAKVQETNAAFEKYKSESKSRGTSSKADTTELEDLMLLMDDMDETNKKYKARLKALGEDVSSDEGSEEESDDGSDEE